MWKELPIDWLEGLDIKTQIASPTYRNAINKYKIDCGGDLAMWESSGWIMDVDPYGWFQWYVDSHSEVYRNLTYLLSIPLGTLNLSMWLNVYMQMLYIASLLTPNFAKKATLELARCRNCKCTCRVVVLNVLIYYLTLLVGSYFLFTLMLCSNFDSQQIDPSFQNIIYLRLLVYD